jgi:hypothetical protein
MFLNWAILAPYNSSSNGDLESGAKGKTVHPGMTCERLCELADQNDFDIVMWYSLTYIVRQLFPVDSFLFGIVLYYCMSYFV